MSGTLVDTILIGRILSKLLKNIMGLPLGKLRRPFGILRGVQLKVVMTLY